MTGRPNDPHGRPSDDTIRRLIAEHYAAAGKDEVATSAIYADDAVLEFPQGGERIRGRANIRAFREAYPVALEFEARRTIGSGSLWVNEYVIRYDGKPSHAVGIMEFRGDKVVRETIYIGDPWDPPAWRAQWVEQMDADEPTEPPTGQAIVDPLGRIGEP